MSYRTNRNARRRARRQQPVFPGVERKIASGARKMVHSVVSKVREVNTGYKKLYEAGQNTPKIKKIKEMMKHGYRP